MPHCFEHAHDLYTVNCHTDQKYNLAYRASGERNSDELPQLAASILDLTVRICLNVASAYAPHVHSARYYATTVTPSRSEISLSPPMVNSVTGI